MKMKNIFSKIKLGWVLFWMYFIASSLFNIFTNALSYDKVGVQEDKCMNNIPKAIQKDSVPIFPSMENQ